MAILRTVHNARMILGIGVGISNMVYSTCISRNKNVRDVLATLSMTSIFFKSLTSIGSLMQPSSRFFCTYRYRPSLSWDSSILDKERLHNRSLRGCIWGSEERISVPFERWIKRKRLVKKVVASLSNKIYAVYVAFLLATLELLFVHRGILFDDTRE